MKGTSQIILVASLIAPICLSHAKLASGIKGFHPCMQTTSTATPPYIEFIYSLQKDGYTCSQGGQAAGTGAVCSNGQLQNSSWGSTIRKNSGNLWNASWGGCGISSDTACSNAVNLAVIASTVYLAPILGDGIHAPYCNVSLKLVSSVQ